MTRLGLLLVAVGLAGAGCLSPVDADAPLVSRCTGDCPFGTCNSCVFDAGAPENDPAVALQVYSCLKEKTLPCPRYVASRFAIATPPPGASGGAYCFTTTEVPPRTFAVPSSDAGLPTPVNCTVNDGGSACRPCFRKTYNVSPGDAG